MGRVEMRRYRRRQGQAAAARLLLLLSLLVIAFGLLSRTGTARMNVARVDLPTATPVASVYDETPVTRETQLPAETWYAIRIGVCGSEADAKACAQTYADRGAPGLPVQDGGQYHVFIAAFGQRQDALSVQEHLHARQSVETDLYPWGCPAVTLRLSGAAGQVDVAEAGLGMALTAAVQLRDTASALDQGAVSSQETLSAVTALSMQFDTWGQAVSDRFDRPYPALIQAELALAEEWAAAARTVRAAAGSGTTALSAALKGQAMHLYDQVRIMRGGITDD